MIDTLPAILNALAPLADVTGGLLNALHYVVTVFMFAVADAVDGWVMFDPTSGWSIVVEEDSPWWDCATMGNRICGPEAP